MRATLIGLLCALTKLAVTDDRLDKPPLADDLDYLKKGLLEYLHPVKSSHTMWAPKWIPEACKNMTEDAHLTATDVEIFSVQYDDCPKDPWILCRHKDSPEPFTTVIDRLGRVPVRARQWVRHVISLPDPNKFASAYNTAGNIAIFDVAAADLNVFVHETGHSLDRLGAYSDHPFSSSNNWLKNYALDSHVPDPYSQTNQFENVAQNTVIAVFNLNVPGGVGTVEAQWREIRHQMVTIEEGQEQKGNFLVRGGKCDRRLENDKMVKVEGLQSRVMMARETEEEPDVGLSDGADVIEPVDFDTRDSCRRGP